MTLHRWTRRFLVGLASVVGLVVILVALLQTGPVATWAARRLLRYVPLNPGYALEVGRVSGNWITGLQLERVRLRYDGRELARIDRLRAGYDPRRLRGTQTRINSVTIDGAHAVARRGREGWDLGNALRRSTDTTGGRPLAVGRVELRNVQLTAEFGPDSTLQVRGLTLRARDLVLGNAAVVTIDTVAAEIAPPTPSAAAARRLHWLAVAGRGAATAEEFRIDPLRITSDRSKIAGAIVLPRRWDDARLVDRFALRLDAAPLGLADVAAWVPGVRPEGDLRLAVRASTNGRLATGHLAGQLGDATVALESSTMLGSKAPTAIGVRGTLRGLDPALVYVAAPAGRINAALEAELEGPNFEQANGRVDVRVTNSRIAETAVEHIGLQANVADGRAELVVRGAIGRSPVTANGWVRPFDSIPSYRLAGEARRLPGTDSLARQLVGRDGDPALALRFAVAGEGAALKTARITGRADVLAIRQNGERVPLGGAPFALANGRLELRPELRVAGGQVTGLAIVQLGDTLTYEIRRGRIERLDLGRLTGDTVAAPLSGRFTVAGRGIAPAEVVATGQLAIDEFQYGAQRIEGVAAEGRLDHGNALFQAGAAVQGGRFTLAVTARPFDSTRTFVIRRASLDHVDVGTWLGRPDLAGPVTLRLSGRGRSTGHTRAFRGRVDVEPSRLGRIDVRAGTLAAALDNNRATYELAMQTNGGAIALAGDATALGTAPGTTPAFTIQHGRFDSLNFATFLGRPQLASRLAGRFTASATGRGLDSLRAGLDVELLPSRVGETTLRGGQLAFGVDRGAIRGDVRLESSDGQFRGQAALQSVSDSAGLLSLGGTITAAGGFRGVHLDSLRLALNPVPGAIDVDTVLLRSNVARLDGRGRVAIRQGAGTGTGTDTLHLVGQTHDLTALAALTGVDTVAVDSARVLLTMAGPAWHWKLAGEVEAHRLLYSGRQVEQLALRATVSVDSTRVAGMSGELRMQGGAVGRVRISEAAAVARYDSVVALQATATLQDSVRLVTAVRGVVASDTIRTTVERLEFVEGGRTWALEQPAPLVVRPRLEVDSLALRSGDRRIVVDGTLDRRGTSDLSLRVDGLDLDVLRELGLSPIPGRLDGYLRLAGPAATPSLEGRVGLIVRRQNEELGRIATDLSWTATGLRINATAAPHRGRQLTANGTLPWGLTLAPADTGARAAPARGPSDTLGFVVRADSFDLAFFNPLLPPATAKDLHGVLALDARVAGTTETPRVEGSVRLTQAGVALPLLGLTYTGGELAGDFTGADFRVTRLRLRTDKHEELLAQGTVGFRPLTNPTLDLTADLRDFRISNSPTLRTMASGKLELKGTAAEPSLTGRLRLGRTEVFQGAEGKATAVKPVELTPKDMQELAQHFGPAALARAEQGPGLVERFRLDIDLRLPGNVWFRRRVNPKADIELSGQLKLKQEPGQEMQFFGRVEPTPQRGVLSVYGRDFRLTGGEIVMAGPVDSMTLNVTAQYQVPTQAGPDAGLLIDVAARGRADSLSLEFTSEPTLGQEDIISYIVTGRPASENPLAQEGGSPTEAGAELAFGALSERVAGATGEKLGLDVFQIKPDGLRGLTLTAGRYIAPRVFLSLQQPIQLSRDAQQTPGANMGPGFEVEYAARRGLRANVRGGSLPLRFFLRSRYAY